MALKKVLAHEIDLQEQVISKERVVENGEVFTAPREVNAMLDLVQDESFRIESKFLEPSCGTGNFLVEILNRKLRTVEKIFANQSDWELAALKSVANIYGIELMDDTANISRKRMLDIFETEYKRLFKNIDKKILKVAKFIISTNIIIGDTLKMQTADGTPITFTEWIFEEDKVVRKEFTMQSMIAFNKQKQEGQCNLFAEEQLQPVKVYRAMKYINLGG